MGGRDTVPLDDCRGGETGEIGFAQYKDSDTLWVWPKNTHLDKIKILHRVSIPKASTNSLQNMMLQHASIDTFIKPYLPRRSGDIRAILSGYEPQKDLMRAASRMTRWIDPGRPHALTVEQSQSVDKVRRVRQLLALLPGKVSGVW